VTPTLRSAVVGSAADCDFRLYGDDVAPRHALITHDSDDEYRISCVGDAQLRIRRRLDDTYDIVPGRTVISIRYIHVTPGVRVTLRTEDVVCFGAHVELVWMTRETARRLREETLREEGW